MANATGNDDLTSPSDGPDEPSRRRAILTGVAVGAAAWVAPAILQTQPAMAQASGTPPGGSGVLAGMVARCNPTFDLQQGECYEVVATSQSDASTFSGSTPTGPALNGTYLIMLPPGIYDLAIGPCDESAPAEEIFDVEILDGQTTTVDYGYQGFGC